MQRPARAHGFTLLELLVAMIILSLIMTIAFSALRVGIKSWNLSAQRLNESADLRAAYRFIANKITHCYPMTWRTGQKEMPAFEGDAQGFKLIAPSPQGKEEIEYFQYFFHIERADNGYDLTLYYAPYYPAEEEFSVDDNSPKRVLFSGLPHIEIKYFGKEKDQRSERWFDTWDKDSQALPMRVKLAFQSPEDDGKLPELVADLRAERHSLR